MRTLLLIVLLVSLFGCASSATKATQYCDSNWQGRYNSWESCYNTQLSQQNKGAKAAGAFFTGFSNGMKNANNNQ